MQSLDTIWQFALELAAISLLSIGGVQSILPEIQRKVVDINAWMDESTFADLYAMGTAAPGPNVLVITLIGFQMAGVAGALILTAAMTIPTCMVAHFGAQVWERFREARWRRVVQSALAPITVGLMLSAAWLLTLAADHTIKDYTLTAVAAGVLLLASRINPIWLIIAGAGMGLAGWL